MTHPMITEAIARTTDTIIPELNRRGKEIESLRQQLAECERERENYRSKLVSNFTDNYAPLLKDVEIGKQMLGNMMGAYAEMREQLATVTAERDELVKLLQEASSEFKKLPHSLGYDITHCQRYDAALAKLGADKTGDVW